MPLIETVSQDTCIATLPHNVHSTLLPIAAAIQDTQLDSQHWHMDVMLHASPAKQHTHSHSHIPHIHHLVHFITRYLISCQNVQQHSELIL